MNAPERILTDAEAIPACLKLADEVCFMWSSKRCLIIIKDGDNVTLNAADLRKLFGFARASLIEEQL